MGPSVSLDALACRARFLLRRVIRSGRPVDQARSAVSIETREPNVEAAQKSSRSFSASRL